MPLMTSSGAFEVKRNKLQAPYTRMKSDISASYPHAFHPQKSFGSDRHHCSLRFWWELLEREIMANLLEFSLKRPGFICFGVWQVYDGVRGEFIPGERVFVPCLSGIYYPLPCLFPGPLFFYNLAETSLREKYSWTSLNGAGLYT